MVLAHESFMVVHPAFYLALSLQEEMETIENTPNLDGNVKINVSGDIVGSDVVVQKYYYLENATKNELNKLQVRLKDWTLAKL